MNQRGAPAAELRMVEAERHDIWMFGEDGMDRGPQIVKSFAMADVERVAGGGSRHRAGVSTGASQTPNAARQTAADLWTSRRFHAHQSERSSGYTRRFARQSVGGGHHLHALPWAMPENDPANEGTCIASKQPGATGNADDRPG